MNQSKTGLNDSFYKWIDEVKRALRKIDEYEDKIEYYKVKLIGYKSVSFDQILSTISNFKSDESILYWIDKINEAEAIYKDALDKFNECDRFSLTLNFEETEYLNYMIEYFKNKECPIPYGRRKQLKPIIARKWFNYMSQQ